MAHFPTKAQQTTSSDAGSGGCSCGGSANDHDPGTGGSGFLARVAEQARRVADMLAPFTSLLTAIVQGASVVALVRQA